MLRHVTDEEIEQRVRVLRREIDLQNQIRPDMMTVIERLTTSFVTGAKPLAIRLVSRRALTRSASGGTAGGISDFEPVTKIAPERHPQLAAGLDQPQKGVATGAPGHPSACRR